MSIHGICFDNGMGGNCNEDCELYGCSDCGLADEIDISKSYHLTNNQSCDILISNQRKDVKEMEVISNETNTSFEAVIFAPGANADNTKISVDTKTRKIFVTVDIKSIKPKFMSKKCDLSGETIIKIPEQCKSIPKVSICDGIIHVKTPTADHIQEVKIG